LVLRLLRYIRGYLIVGKKKKTIPRKHWEQINGALTENLNFS